MRKLLLLMAGTAAVAGCTGAAGSPPLPRSAAIEYAAAFGSFSAPSVGAAPLVLYDQQFLDFGASSYILGVTFSPAGSAGTVTWTSSNSAALPLEQQQPFTGSLPGDPAPTAPPNETFVQTGNAYGTSTIAAKIAGTNITAAITAYHYHSLSFGCDFRFEPAWAFDPDRFALMQDEANWSSGDLYDTAPANQLELLDPCYQSPLATAPGTTELWHTPYGGVLLPSVSVQAFTSIAASQWRNAGTQFAPVDAALLLFKTHEGRIVKALLPIGPYEVSDLSGNFPY